MRKFITELRRRNVVKVGTVYVVVAWALMQGADVMFPALNLPQWTVTLVAALVIVGFPVALVLAWAYIAVLLRAGRRSRSLVRVPARDPELDPIREDPRFREFLATLGE